MNNTVTLPREEDSESVKVWITKEHHPILWENKVKCLEDTCDSREEAEELAEQIFSSPIELELLYEVGTGLFAIESDALACGAECFSPFSKARIVEAE